MIHSLNKDGEVKQKSIEIITKYLENIISNPSEQKFCRIRMQNKALQEKVLVTKGALEYLKGVGFEVRVEHINTFFYDLNIFYRKKRRTLKMDLRNFSFCVKIAVIPH